MSEHRCPIPGCAHVYTRGLTGWFQHVAKMKHHPEYYPDVDDMHARTTLYREDFPKFFEEAAATEAPPAAPSSRSRIRHLAPLLRCPLRGCKHLYEGCIDGWEAHVGNWDNHPDYLSEVASPKLRAAMFQRDFPGWFQQATRAG